MNKIIYDHQWSSWFRSPQSLYLLSNLLWRRHLSLKFSFIKYAFSNDAKTTKIHKNYFIWEGRVLYYVRLPIEYQQHKDLSAIFTVIKYIEHTILTYLRLKTIYFHNVSCFFRILKFVTKINHNNVPNFQNKINFQNYLHGAKSILCKKLIIKIRIHSQLKKRTHTKRFFNVFFFCLTMYITHSE